MKPLGFTAAGTWIGLSSIVTLLCCGGKVDDNQLMQQSPTTHIASITQCEDITDYKTCAYRGCLWGGPDHCDGHSAPSGDVVHQTAGGCFAVTACTTSSDCGAKTVCGYLAYAPCYFAADGDGPQCTAYESQVCTYLQSCVPAAQ